MPELLFLIPIFFFIAMIYASAGFGGGSSYLAILSLAGLEFLDLRMLALICNIVVVSSSVFLLSKYGFINYRKIFPLIFFSVPLAFLGGALRLSDQSFFLLLGISLLISSIIMLIDLSTNIRKLPRFTNGFIGGSIGFLSGMVGIGGGIFLSPLLHISKWDKPKVVAATSALFILVNSFSGFLGQVYTNGFKINPQLLLYLSIAVFFGGQLGIRMTLFNFDAFYLRRITAILVLVVAIRLIIISL